MRRLIVWLLVAGTAGTLAACDSPTQPAPLGSTLDPDGAIIPGHAEGVTAAASGAAIRYAELGDGSRLQVLTSFSVHQSDAGTEGFFHYRAGSTEIRVEVTCMTVVDGHRAWIAGVITESTVGFLGHVSYFYTFDNGEGAGSPADVVSLVRVEATPGLGEDRRFCDELPQGLPARNVDQGNVNVRG